jgi:TetR/AcrR family transcriptional repressor of multidrug resistance operon
MSSFAEKQREMKEIVAKEAIYEAALEVISKGNNETLRMQDIADAAGIATGTLYNYFENKERLLYYVDRRLHEVVLDMIQNLVEQSSPAQEKLSKLFQCIFKFCEEYHVVFDLAEKFRVVDQVSKNEKQEGIDMAISSIKKVLDEGVKQKVFRQVDTGSTAKVFFSAMVGMLHLQKYIGEFDYAANCELLLKTFFDYLAVPNS